MKTLKEFIPKIVTSSENTLETVRQTRRRLIIDTNEGKCEYTVSLGIFQYMADNPVYFLDYFKPFLRMSSDFPFRLRYPTHIPDINAKSDTQIKSLMYLPGYIHRTLSEEAKCDNENS